jgi:hypothetical protein
MASFIKWSMQPGALSSLLILPNSVLTCFKFMFCHYRFLWLAKTCASYTLHVISVDLPVGKHTFFFPHMGCSISH